MGGRQNVIDLGDGTYFEHGFEIRTHDDMIELLNEKRKPGSQQSAYLTNLCTRHLLGKNLMVLTN
ncbi:hypothetical protein [Peribacillus alkalitolerans]|uniref:hypothetical protein n=1 Tax=Peribacillus alkalitolerans TaxID=1550385 RepID=UPI003B846677